MINARYDEEFVFHDDTRAKNISDLVLKLEHLTIAEFQRFVNNDKNDFSNWIGAVLKDTFLADELRNVMTLEETIRLIKIRITNSSSDGSISHPKAFINNNTLNHDAIISASNQNSILTNNSISLLGSSSIHASSNAAVVSSKPSAHESFSNMSHMLNSTKEESANISEDIKSSRNWFKFLFEKKSFKKRLDNIQSNISSNNLTSNKPIAVSTVGSSGSINATSGSNNINSTTNSAPRQLPKSDVETTPIVARDSYHKYLFNRKLFSKKRHNLSNNITENKLMNNNVVEIEDSDNKSDLWLIVYIVVIVLIIFLLLYKLFLA